MPKVLVVEDEPLWGERLADVLAEMGYTVRVANSLDEATGEVGKGIVALATVDLVLSHRLRSQAGLSDGMVLLEWLAERGIPAIVITGAGTSEDAKTVARERLAVDFIEKQNFDLQKLLKVVKTTIDERSKQSAPDNPVPHTHKKTNIRVFISSTMDDLRLERESTRVAIEELYLNPIFAEGFGSRTGTPRNEILSEIRDSDIYIGIFWQRYGSITDNEKLISATEEEYREAFAEQKPILIYVKEPAKRDVQLQRFVKELDSFGTGHLRSVFGTCDELREMVKRDIMHEVSILVRKGRKQPRKSTKRR